MPLTYYIQSKLKGDVIDILGGIPAPNLGLPS